MKKFIYTIIATVGLMSAVSCSDMLETESSGQIYDPSLSEKTDSAFYAYGILQAMQQLADQYFFQNEVRGDLVSTTKYATTDLRKLGDFSADTSNKYDSVYLYYKVINNCNYYLKHRRTDLETGGTYVTLNEYIAVASLRAWAYLQLVRQYGDVPYVTEPVVSVSQINSTQKFTRASTILAMEAEYLESLKAKYPYQYWTVPTYGQDPAKPIQVGGDGTKEKVFLPEKCFVPLNVVLGDLYLENAQYEKAALSYYDYIYYLKLQDESKLNVNYGMSPYSRDDSDFQMPNDFDESEYLQLINDLQSGSWSTIFGSGAAPGDVISYIPMASNIQNGKTTEIPQAFGYDYYARTGSYYSYNTVSNCYELDELQLLPSEEFKSFYSTAPYYYMQKKEGTQLYADITSAPIGDARFRMVTKSKQTGSENVYVYKPANANVYLYRTSGVFLHLAEAMNRMGYPDAAFAVLKTGLNGTFLKEFIDTLYIEKPENSGSTDLYFDKKVYFLSTDAAKMLSTKLRFMPQGREDGTDDGFSLLENVYVGIHYHGGGQVTNANPFTAKRSTYIYADVIGNKLAELARKFPERFGDNYQYTKEDSINAMEDLLCDEMALEFAFEGCRFSDLQRMARHKNESGLYGGGFGDAWLADKLKGKGKVITTQNCYLPFK